MWKKRRGLRYSRCRDALVILMLMCICKTMQWGTVLDCSVLKPVSSVQDGTLNFTLFESYFQILKNKTLIKFIFQDGSPSALGARWQLLIK